MRVVIVILCVGLVHADEPPKTADSEVAASEESQWTPFFSEASRASEGLPWGSIAPELASDAQPAPSGRQETHPDPQSASSGRQETNPDVQSAGSRRQETYPVLQHASSGRPETSNQQSFAASHQAYQNPQPDTPNPTTSSFHQQSSQRGDASLTKDRKDVQKVTITKKVRVPYKVHVEKHIPKIIEVPVDKPFNVYVPKPYPVVVEKKVPYEIKVPQPQPYTVEKRVPYPVKVLVDKPYTLHVPKPYPVDVEKKYEFTVEKKVPYEVKVPVERPYPVHVIVEKEVRFPVETKVPVPVKVPYEKPIPVHVSKHVPVNVDKPVPYTVEKVAPYPVKVPFRIPIKVHYPEGGSDEGVHGDVQNVEWAEAMNSATRAAKLESRPSQWTEGPQGLSHFPGESQKPSQWHVELQKPSQGQGESQKPSPQLHTESQYHLESHRPSQWQQVFHRPTHVRQGFSAGRGLPYRNGYLLSNHVQRRPTTKLQPVGHLYKVKEAQIEQLPTTPFLNQPGSEVIVPQMVLADSRPNAAGLQQSNPMNSGLQQSNLQNLPPSTYVSSGIQNGPSANGRFQDGSSLFRVSNSGFSSPMLSNQETSFVDHQNMKNGTPSFSIMNVIRHSGLPSQQSVIHHKTPYALPSNPNQPQVTRLQYFTNNSLGSESIQLPSSTFFKPAQNKTIPSYGTKTSQNVQTQNSAPSPFGTSGFTISFHSPPSAQQQAVSFPQQQPQQQALASPQQQQQPRFVLTSPQLFKPSASSQSPPQSDHTSSSYIGTKTIRQGQELGYSTSIHHSLSPPTRLVQT